MANLPFFSGFAAKKVTATMLSPSSMVADFFLFLLLLIMEFLKINIIVTGGFFFRVVMARGRRLRKSAGGSWK
jgi:formate hydrogenlyase subunit 3/multisubunit Na+/H+ antiporter MnhD subunit